MQQVRKLKRAARSRMTAGKPARNRRTVEQMLVELKQRLCEISDLNAAADVLSWGQATYMPEGGAGARGVSAPCSAGWHTSGQSRRRLAG